MPVAPSLSRLVICAGVVASILLGRTAAAQEAPGNPFAGDPKAIEQGRNIFRGRCAVCHGVDARGYRGSDLTTGEWVHGGGDAQLFRTIRQGVPGTEMPGNSNMPENEIWRVITYLRTLSGPTPGPAGLAAPKLAGDSARAEAGDARRGEQLFWASDKANCGQCHMIAGRGGRLGPNLSRIGAARSAAALEREIRRPDEFIPVSFETITVVTRDGRKIRGARKNEDTFSVQVMTPNEDILSFLKRDVAEVVPDSRSLMPAFGPERLPPADLDDLVRYLRTLRGTPSVTQE